MMDERAAYGLGFEMSLNKCLSSVNVSLQLLWGYVGESKSPISHLSYHQWRAIADFA